MELEIVMFFPFKIFNGEWQCAVKEIQWVLMTRITEPADTPDFKPYHG